MSQEKGPRRRLEFLVVQQGPNFPITEASTRPTALQKNILVYAGYLLFHFSLIIKF